MLQVIFLLFADWWQTDASRYKFVIESRPFQNAEDYCADLNATLLMMETEAELNLITDLINQNPGKLPQGGTDDTNVI